MLLQAEDSAKVADFFKCVWNKWLIYKNTLLGVLAIWPTGTMDLQKSGLFESEKLKYTNDHFQTYVGAKMYF